MDQELSLNELCQALRDNCFPHSFIDLSSKQIGCVQDLFMLMDALGGNRKVLGVKFPDLYIDNYADFELAFTLLNQTKALFKQNQVCLGLEGSVHFFYKRVARELNFHFSKDEMTIRAVNQDNVNLTNPGEFDIVAFPGGQTRSCAFDLFSIEEDYPSSVEVAKFKRTEMLTNAVAHCQTKKELADILANCDLWNQSGWSPQVTAEDIYKGLDSIYFGYFTRQFGVREQLIKLDPEQSVGQCATKGQLFYVLDILKQVQGSLSIYPAAYLKFLIQQDPPAYENIPRTYGIRQAVRRICPLVPQAPQTMLYGQAKRKSTEFKSEGSQSVRFDLSQSEAKDPPNKRQRLG